MQKKTKSPCLGPYINKPNRCGSTSLNIFTNLEATAWQTCWNNLLKSFEIMWKFLPFALPYLFRKGSFSSTDYVAPIKYLFGWDPVNGTHLWSNKTGVVFLPPKKSFLQTLSNTGLWLSSTKKKTPSPSSHFNGTRHHKFTFGRRPQTARAK